MMDGLCAECERGKRFKHTNGNCDVAGADDQAVQCVGPWAKEKHDYLRRYIEATHSVRAKYIPKLDDPRYKGGAAFVDLFAGPGRARIRKSGEEIDGSPLIAVRHSTARFTRIIACDTEEENVAALRARTRDDPRVVVVAGSCHDKVEEIARYIPPHGLNIALIDPFSLDQLRFETIEALARFERMDLLIHFPTMDIKRNVERAGGAERLSRAVGGDAGVVEAKAAVDAIGVLRERLRPLGYVGDAIQSVAVKNSTNNVLYHLVFASKHDRGNKIWNSIARIDAHGQRSLF